MKGNMPNQDFYADAAPPAAQEAPASEPTTQESDQEESQDESQTAEIPKAILGGKDFKPGEEVVLEVVQVMENSVLVKYASDSGEDEAPTEPAAPAPQGGPMSSLME